jgi:hypothetical protein
MVYNGIIVFSQLPYMAKVLSSLVALAVDNFEMLVSWHLSYGKAS